MISALKQPPANSIAIVDLARVSLPSLRRRIPLPSLPASTAPSLLRCSSRVSLKPLCASSSLKGLSFGSRDDRLELRCEAYEADRSAEVAAEPQSAVAQKVKIGIYFATWWALNVVFNIYNKKVLNAFAYPWLTSTLSLACGSLMMLISWATRIAEAPNTDFDFWKALFPVRKYRFLMFSYCLIVLLAKLLMVSFWLIIFCVDLSFPYLSIPFFLLR